MEQLNFGISKQLDNLSNSQIEMYMNFQKEVIKIFILFKGDENTKERKEQELKIEQELKDMLRFELDLINVKLITNQYES